MRIYITGIGGLVGSTVAEYMKERGHEVAGCDNNNRQTFFDSEGSVLWRLDQLREKGINVRLMDQVSQIDEMVQYDAIIHTAGQPSHDLSFRFPILDANTNYMDTLRILDGIVGARRNPLFIFLSTNKVYGSHVNTLSYDVVVSRFVPNVYSREWCNPHFGVNELCPIDNTSHTPFGISKLAADLAVQEYSRRYELRTCVLRCGCLTGSAGSPVELHGFLGYLVKCAVEDRPYFVYGYDGLQVRDNLDCRDLAKAMDMWMQRPISGVFNMGGGRKNSISVREAITELRQLGYQFPVTFAPERYADHKWWISDTRAFESLYGWEQTYEVKEILHEMVRRKCGRGEPQTREAAVATGAQQGERVQ